MESHNVQQAKHLYITLNYEIEGTSNKGDFWILPINSEPNVEIKDRKPPYLDF